MAKNKTKWKIEIIALECLIICTLLGVLFIKKVDSYKFEQDASYFEETTIFTIPKGTVAKVNKETNEVSFKLDESDYIANSVPAYLKNEDSIVLLKDLSIFNITNDNTIGRHLTYFSKCLLKDSGSVIVSRGKNSRTQQNGFLFDGKDTYVLLDNMSITFDEKRVYLPKLSWIKVIPNSCFVCFNYQYETIDCIYTANNVYAKADNDLYEIDMTHDIVNRRGEQTMLRSFVEAYPLYFAEGKK